MPPRGSTGPVLDDRPRPPRPCPGDQGPGEPGTPASAGERAVTHGAVQPIPPRPAQPQPTAQDRARLPNGGGRVPAGRVPGMMLLCWASLGLAGPLCPGTGSGLSPLGSAAEGHMTGHCFPSSHRFLKLQRLCFPPAESCQIQTHTALVKLCAWSG